MNLITNFYYNRKHRIVTAILEKRFPLLCHKIPGFMSPEELQCLYLAVLLNQPKKILEIGHFLGKSTASICEAIKHSNQKIVFDSYDIPFTSVTDWEDFFGEKIKPLYEKHLLIGRTATEECQSNLSKLELSEFVTLHAQDFNVNKTLRYDLIFADVLHDRDEITRNLNDIIRYGHKNTIYIFDDMKYGNISSVVNNSKLRFLSSVGKLGIFKVHG